MRPALMEVSVKSVVLALCLLPIAFEAQAISRYDATSMTCAQVQSAIDQEGAVILRYPSPRDASIERYDRYVRDRHFCKHNERADTTMVPASDSKACPVRECRQVEPERRPKLLRRNY